MFWPDAFGLFIRKEFEEPLNEHSMSSGRSIWQEGKPLEGEDLYEFLFLEQAILDTGAQSFSMVELGCGYGRWLGTAWKHIRTILNQKDRKVYLLGVEPSPGRKAFFEQFVNDNGILFDPNAFVSFAQYGVAKHEAVGGIDESNASIGYGKSIASGNTFVKAYPLARLLPQGEIDYLSMDIQGMEVDAITGDGSGEALRRCRHVHIATHGGDLGKNCKARMEALGFQCTTSIPKGMVLGNVVFIDGMEQFIRL